MDTTISASVIAPPLGLERRDDLVNWQPGAATRLAPRMSSACIPICASMSNVLPVQATFGNNLTSEVPFTGARLILANYSEVPLALGGLCAAVSASDSSAVVPVDADLRPSAWKAVTVDGKVPLLPAGSAMRPAIVVSDLLAIESLDRVDGGSGHLLFTRTLGSAEGPNYFNQALCLTSMAEFSSQTPGPSIHGWYAGGDYVSGPQVADPTSPQIDFPAFIVAGAIFQSTQRCMTVMGAGDSLTQGLTSGAGYTGFARYGAAASRQRATTGVSFVDAGYAGQTTRQFTDRARDLIEAGIPVDVLTVPIDSPNDYAAGISRVQQECTILSFVDFALSRGIAVILVTSLPFKAGAGDLGFGQDRVLSSEKLRRLRQPGVMLLDAQTIVSGFVASRDRLPTTPDICLGSDGAHLGEVAHRRIGQELSDLLLTISG